MRARATLTDIPELETAINALGVNDVERAAALGLSERSLSLWRNNGVPALVLRFMTRPELAAALARAAENNRTVITEIAS